MASGKLRLAIVDQYEVVRRGLRELLKDWPHGEVVLEAANGLEYERACVGLPRIHIAIVGMRMQVRDGYQTIGWIDKHQPRTQAVAMAFDPTALMALRVLRVGGRGMVCKTILQEGWFTVLDQVRTAGFHYNEWVSKGLRMKVEEEQAQRQSDPALLPPRLREFLVLYTEIPLLSLEETAERMGIKRTGAEDLRKRVAKRIGYSDRAEMVHYAWTNGMH